MKKICTFNLRGHKTIKSFIYLATYSDSLCMLIISHPYGSDSSVTFEVTAVDVSLFLSTAGVSEIGAD